jgi:hypothetical protein
MGVLLPSSGSGVTSIAAIGTSGGDVPWINVKVKLLFK